MYICTYLYIYHILTVPLHQDGDHFQKLRSPKSLSLLQFSYYPPQKKVISKDTFGAQTDGVISQ